MAKRSKKRSAGQASIAWPADAVEQRPLSELYAYANNSRTHTNKQIEKIARSIQEFGWTNPVLISEENQIIAGHGRVLAAETLGIESVPVIVAHGWTEAQIRAYVIADNQLAIDAGWDVGMLQTEIEALAKLDFDIGLLGFETREIGKILRHGTEQQMIEQADELEAQELASVAVSRLGDLWALGENRILCGDSTNSDDVSMLFGEDFGNVECIIADPPYGMGKEADGVANDNLYREKLDRFQMAWIIEAFSATTDRSSIYIWGLSPDLWRLWYQGGLCDIPEIMLRNEIVWDKGNGFGITSAGQHSYPIATERCLFAMRGQQFIGNQNTEDYWDGWEPLRSWLVEQRDRAGWKNRDVNRITGIQMAGHWFSKSQFQPISKENYNLLRDAADGVAFLETYEELVGSKFLGILASGNEARRNISAQIRSIRTYFDNTHDAMTDVWKFPRVVGEERHGHATPKPVGLMARSIKSSTPNDGWVYDPFSGTGTVTIAAELTGRRCLTMEIEPLYVDTTIRRWEAQTGKKAIRVRDGATFAAASRKKTARKTKKK